MANETKNSGETPQGAPRGRPKGSTGVRGRTRDRLLAQAEVKPLEVLLKVMARRWKIAEAETDLEQKVKLENEACAIAEKAAPYVHGRLQATTIKSEGNPLTFTLALPGAEALKAAIRGEPSTIQPTVPAKDKARD